MENKSTHVLHAFGMVVLDISTSPLEMEPVEYTGATVEGNLFLPIPSG